MLIAAKDGITAPLLYLSELLFSLVSKATWAASVCMLLVLVLLSYWLLWSHCWWSCYYCYWLLVLLLFPPVWWLTIEGGDDTNYCWLDMIWCCCELEVVAAYCWVCYLPCILFIITQLDWGCYCCPPLLSELADLYWFLAVKAVEPLSEFISITLGGISCLDAVVTTPLRPPFI